jgi:hypothetical protein
MGDKGYAWLGLFCAMGLPGALRRQPIKKLKERGRAQALGGRRFFNLNNNQPKEGICDGGDIGHGMQPRQNMSGGILALFGAANRSIKK